MQMNLAALPLDMLETVALAAQAGVAAKHPDLKLTSDLKLNPVEAKVLLEAITQLILPALAEAARDAKAKGRNPNDLCDRGLMLCRIAERLDAENKAVLPAAAATDIARMRRNFYRNIAYAERIIISGTATSASILDAENKAVLRSAEEAAARDEDAELAEVRARNGG